jgi:tetratricopeptide (TPR) repeat protein
MFKLAVWMLVLITFQAGAQKALLSEKEQRKVEVADQLLIDKNYSKASTLYQELLEKNESNAYLKLRMAETWVGLHNPHEAREWYIQVFGKTGHDVPDDVLPVHMYQYAGILLTDGKTDEALYWYELYRQRNPDDTRAARKIEGIKSIVSLKQAAPAYAIGGTSLNSTYADFSPAYYGRGLVFVSGRARAEAKGSGEDAAFLDLYYSDVLSDGSLSEAKKFSDAINTDFNEGPCIFYGKDKRLIFTRNNLKGKRRVEDEDVVVQLQLFNSDMDTVTNTWKKPELLSINSDRYSIGHPAISSDGQHLYFSSNMPGNYGDTDLYVSDQVNGTWSEPKNLGAMVNTEGSEMFPFLHADSVLYFASDGHGGFGGLDIYRYSIPRQKLENIGAPINGGYDDFGLILDATGETGYFSSSRNQSGGDKNDDIFYVKKNKPEEKPAPTVASVESDVVVVIDPLPEPEEKEIYYTIQILAVKNRKLVKKSFLQDLKGVLKHDGKDGFHRYTYGRFGTLEEATVVLEEVKRQGYTDAFLRREERYKELSERPGIAIDRFYMR